MAITPNCVVCSAHPKLLLLLLLLSCVLLQPFVSHYVFTDDVTMSGNAEVNASLFFTSNSSNSSVCVQHLTNLPVQLLLL
jgi:hypothetical protein